LNAFKQAFLNSFITREINYTAVVTIAVITATLLAWIAAIIVMADMDQGPGTHLHDFKTYIIGWVIMLTAMMLPSEVQYIKVYANLRAKEFDEQNRKRTLILYTVIFAMGYGIAWIAYGSLAFLLDSVLRMINFEFIAWDKSGPIVSGIVLITAAAYQVSPLKNACLTHCRNPLSFFARHWHVNYQGVLYTGFLHGLVCVACCWALMAVMFAVGAMNLIWMGILTLLMFAEKIFPFGHKLTIPIAVFLVVVGIWIIVSPDSVPYLTNPLIHEALHHQH